jgi:rhomboid family GlyGly-CTERM serine protease
MKTVITQQMSYLTIRRIIAVISVLIVFQICHSYWDLAWDRINIANGDYWRLISGHLVHNNSNHLLLNGVGVTVGLVLIGDSFSLRSFCTLNLMVALLTSLFLYFFEPQLYYYVGYSAVLHGLIVSYAISKLLTMPWFGAAIICALALKLLLEGKVHFTANLIDIRVATEAHLWGFISGLIAGMAFICSAYWQKKPSPQGRESSH